MLLHWLLIVLQADELETKIQHCISRMDVEDISTALCELLKQSTRDDLLKMATTETLTEHESEQAAYEYITF